MTMKLRTPVKSILPSVMGIQVEEAGEQGPNSGKSQRYFFFNFAKKQEVSLSVAQISCLKRTAIGTIVSLA